MTPGTKMWVDLRPGGAWDADASRSAAVLAAYFQLEDARNTRHRVCLVVIAIALLACGVTVFSRLVDPTGFATVLTALATAAAAAVIMEWRAEKRLEALMPRG